MEILLSFLRSLAISLAVIWVISSFVNWHLYGKFLRGKYINQFLDKYLKDYELNKFDPTMLSAPGALPYMATRRTIFSKWYIYNIGRVFRWSEAHKRIERYHKKLLRNI